MPGKRTVLVFALAVAVGPVAAHAASLAATTEPRLAYIDPGSGSFILQALVATVAGLAVAVNAYWRKIKQFLGIGSAAPEEDSADHASSDD